MPTRMVRGILCYGGYNIRWAVNKVTTVLGHRRVKFIVAVHAHLFLIAERAGPCYHWTALPLCKTKCLKKVFMYSVTVNACSVITSAILALLHIKYTCGLGSLLLLQISFNSNEFKWSDCCIRHLIKLSLEQNTDLSMLTFYHNSWICSLCIFLRT